MSRKCKVNLHLNFNVVLYVKYSTQIFTKTKISIFHAFFNQSNWRDSIKHLRTIKQNWLQKSWKSWKLANFPSFVFWDAKSFSFLSWQTKKFYSPKKYFLSRCQYQNKKALFTDPIFSEGFEFYHVKKAWEVANWTLD